MYPFNCLAGFRFSARMKIFPRSAAPCTKTRRSFHVWMWSHFFRLSRGSLKGSHILRPSVVSRTTQSSGQSSGCHEFDGKLLRYWMAGRSRGLRTCRRVRTRTSTARRGVGRSMPTVARARRFGSVDVTSSDSASGPLAPTLSRRSSFVHSPRVWTLVGYQYSGTRMSAGSRPAAPRRSCRQTVRVENAAIGTWGRALERITYVCRSSHFA